MVSTASAERSRTTISNAFAAIHDASTASVDHPMTRARQPGPSMPRDSARAAAGDGRLNDTCWLVAAWRSLSPA